MFNMLEGKNEAVLVLDIDPANEVRLSLEDPRPAPSFGTGDLRSADDRVIGIEQTGEQFHGSVWIERDGSLYASVESLHRASDTLCHDLAKTLKFTPQTQLLTVAEVETAAAHGAAFLISDEFGFLPITAANSSEEAGGEMQEAGVPTADVHADAATAAEVTAAATSTTEDSIAGTSTIKNPDTSTPATEAIRNSFSKLWS
jgi:hypothetical protein